MLDRRFSSTQRAYEGVITEVYQRSSPADPSGTPGASGQRGDDNVFTYDAIAVDTPEPVTLTDAKPFRRIIRSDLNDRPQIIAASVGDPCRIAINGTNVRLIDVLEQYIAEDCQPTTTPV